MIKVLGSLGTRNCPILKPVIPCKAPINNQEHEHIIHIEACIIAIAAI